MDFGAWLAGEKRILLHAGGQSRRLPAYAPAGKVLTPIPIFRWKRGQCIDQTLLSLQMPLYRDIMAAAPAGLRTLIASGDVYIRTAGTLGEIPEADVVCYGLWAEPELARNHGVFVIDRQQPEKLDYMLQKPDTSTLSELTRSHFFLMDIGIWLLSDRAVEMLRRRSTAADGSVCEYDLYGAFGCALGANPSKADGELSSLSVAVLPLNGGEFYHYGTSRELISSTTAVQNLVKDQRFIIQREVKRQPSVFTQNSVVGIALTDEYRNIWIENSHVPSSWSLTEEHVITGVPRNKWKLALGKGQCIDLAPVGEDGFAVRPYGFRDASRGSLLSDDTLYIGIPVTEWLVQRGLTADDVAPTHDLQAARIFPVTDDIVLAGKMAAWLLGDLTEDLREVYLSLRRMSADEISAEADLYRMEEQRHEFRRENLPAMAKRYANSVFYQANLKHIAKLYVEQGIALPDALPDDTPLMTRIHDAMFRAEYLQRSASDYKGQESKAFALLAEGLTAGVLREKQSPTLGVCHDQIVWGRCPVRIDLAGGWTDTPPYSLTTGGNVVNMAIMLNGQPPLQVYVKPCKEPVIICRSIDLGATERIETYEALADFSRVGSPFSIPKAALALAGFSPKFSAEKYPSLRARLEAFGSGIEITLLSAIPAGSGLGTSSILAATVLGALSDFCHLSWDSIEVCNRTLVLEQLLTTGGGWQDQYGGVLPGVKLLQSQPGFDQTPVVRWLPDSLFSREEYKACHLLYYTGLTRTAKDILAEIVRGMFLNNTRHLDLLDRMKQHAVSVHDVLQKGDFEAFGRLVGKTWAQNQLLDSGTAPEKVQRICSLIHDYCLGYKLPGAGGGGFLYMVTKDPEAAVRIRRVLEENRLSPTARFVEMSLSGDGLQVSRS